MVSSLRCASDDLLGPTISWVLLLLLATLLLTAYHLTSWISEPVTASSMAPYTKRETHLVRVRVRVRLRLRAWVRVRVRVRGRGRLRVRHEEGPTSDSPPARTGRGHDPLPGPAVRNPPATR